MIARPMHAAEIAQRMGVALETFYRRRKRYHTLDGMPRPITETGRPAYDRAGMEAWLTRNDPRRPKAMVAANDAIATPLPAGDDEWNAFLHQHYRQAAE